MSKVASARPETRIAAVSRKTVRTSGVQLYSPSRLSWSLPSGESLAEFALRFGFLAPPLLSPTGSRGVARSFRFREGR